jgi:hypothetical protein
MFLNLNLELHFFDLVGWCIDRAGRERERERQRERERERERDYFRITPLSVNYTLRESFFLHFRLRPCGHSAR